MLKAVRMRVSASLDGKPDVHFPPVSRVVSAGFGERSRGGEGRSQRPARRRRSELVTTMTLEQAMAAPAIMGLSSPAAASGIAATL